MHFRTIQHKIKKEGKQKSDKEKELKKENQILAKENKSLKRELSRLRRQLEKSANIYEADEYEEDQPTLAIPTTSSIQCPLCGSDKLSELVVAGKTLIACKDCKQWRKMK